MIAAKKEKLTMWSLEEQLGKHGFEMIPHSSATNYALEGRTVVCVFPDTSHMKDWLARYWHTINGERKIKDQIETFSKQGITFKSGGKIYPRLMMAVYDFYGYDIEKTVIAMYR
jgi:hypothetical protein